MSLLTNEQIAELVGIASNQSTSMDLYEEFHDWNEKQTGLQVNVDWSRTPDTAIGASVSVSWVIENGFNTLGYHLAKYDRPPKPVTTHPHAELIMKYAEVAQRRADPWVEFEWFDDCLGKWVVFKEMSPMFSFRKIRHIGEIK
jgi:hypothetical protein